MNLSKLTWWLLIIGGLNWLLVGLFDKDVFNMLSIGGWLPRLVYLAVGVSTLFQLFGKKSSSM